MVIVILFLINFINPQSRNDYFYTEDRCVTVPYTGTSAATRPLYDILIYLNITAFSLLK